MSKADILNSIASISSSSAVVTAKLVKLKAARTAVENVSTQLDYKVTNPGHLEGDKYDLLEDGEKQILMTLKRDMVTKKGYVIEELDTKISQLQAEANSLSSSLNYLSQQLAYEED